MPIEAKASCVRFNISLCVIGLVMVWIHDTKSPRKKRRLPRITSEQASENSGETFVGWVCLVPLPHPAIFSRKHLGVSARLLVLHRCRALLMSGKN